MSQSITEYNQDNEQPTFDIADSWLKLESACKEKSDQNMDQEKIEETSELEKNQMSESKIHPDKRPILELTLGKLKGASLEDAISAKAKNTLVDYVIQKFGQETRGFELISLEPDFGKVYQNYIYQKCHKCHKSADK